MLSVEFSIHAPLGINSSTCDIFIGHIISRAVMFQTDLRGGLLKNNLTIFSKWYGTVLSGVFVMTFVLQAHYRKRK